MSRAVIHWRGSRPPTPAELLRIASMHLGPGTYEARPASVRRNPETAAQSAYREFHWGVEPRKRARVTVPADREVFAIGKLTAVEYRTRKGRDRATWRHAFGRPFPVLTSTADGRLGPIVGGAARVTKRGIEG